MSGEQSQRSEEIFRAAIALGPADRDAYLTAACGGDAALREEVLRLLSSHERDRPAESPAAVDPGVRTDRSGEAPAVGRRFGVYRVVREIGRGRLGAAFLAERADGRLEQRVVIRVVERGGHTGLARARFRADLHVLASLDHPNIARLLDVGTAEDGLPYIVMEYVEGRPIDEYADARSLSIADRLELFLRVCDAVAYAHQHLVVHGNIKPPNLLVTAEGVPRLVDLGLGNALSAAPHEAALGAPGHRPPAPEYASPEQVEGSPPTTASDVYSLGVVLYELLTGRSPYRARSPAPEDVAEAMRTTVPARPSAAVRHVDRDGAGPRRRPGLASDRAAATGAGSRRKLRRQLRGDLDSIVLMALRKVPARRYASVEQLAGDIRRHLAGLPVQARSGTLRYRAGKFVRRHRAAVAGTALAGLVLLGGTAAAAWQVRRATVEARLAREAQAQAERRLAEVRKLANTVLFDYQDAIKDVPGAAPVRVRLVRNALQYLDGLAREAPGNPSLQRELANAYQRIGDVQGGATGANLGDTRGALESYRKALRMLDGLGRPDSAPPEIRRQAARLSARVGRLLWESGDVSGALRYAGGAVALLEPLTGATAGGLDLRIEASEAYDLLGGLLLESGHHQEALELRQKQLGLLESAADDERQTPRLRRAWSGAHQGLAEAQVQVGDLAGALENTQRGRALRADLWTESPDSADYRRLVMASNDTEAEILARMGRTRDALGRYRRNLAAVSALAAAEPGVNPEYRRAIAFNLTRIGDMLARLGARGQAIGHYRRALAFRERDFAADSTNLRKRLALIESRVNICRALAGRSPRAARAPCRATASLLQGTAVDPTSAADRGHLARAYSNLGEVYEGLARRRAPPATRRSYWVAARAMYQVSSKIWSDMTARGIVAPADSASVRAAEQAVARADAALRSGRPRRGRAAAPAAPESAPSARFAGRGRAPRAPGGAPGRIPARRRV